MIPNSIYIKTAMTYALLPIFITDFRQMVLREKANVWISINKLKCEYGRVLSNVINPILILLL